MQPREKFCRHHELCRTVWVRKERVVKFIGYDAGEEDRRTKVADRDKADALYQKEYPLMEWGWNRERCICEMQDAGLPLPGKSSCFSVLPRSVGRSVHCTISTQICWNGHSSWKRMPCLTSTSCADWAGTLHGGT